MANIDSVVVAHPDFGEIIVTAHNDRALSNEEWEENYLRYVRDMKSRGKLNQGANLVFAEGKGPSSMQRSAGNAIFGKDQEYTFRVSVITNSLMVRGAVTAISWFNPQIRAFSPSDWMRAYSHVRVTAAHYRLIRQSVEVLAQKVANVAVLKHYLAGTNAA